ncbi:MAG: peptide-methionine (R)-S-oxide reductase MsrB [Burkholderiales bacterium]
MNRREFLLTLGAAGLAAAAPSVVFAQSRPIEQIRAEWKTFVAPGADIVLTPTPPQKLHNTEWKKRLQPAQYNVLREEGTERAGTSPLNDEKRRGVYACAGCGLALFTSDMKFDSGTGWPSFFTSIPGAFATKRDFKLILPRTEYHCIRCEGHHGHLFTDGPKPTGERWCNNGVALRFVPT